MERSCSGILREHRSCTPSGSIEGSQALLCDSGVSGLQEGRLKAHSLQGLRVQGLQGVGFRGLASRASGLKV